MAKGKVTVNEEYCKGCGLCVAVCPKQVLELSKDRLSAKGYRVSEPVNADECIGCINCAIMCPDSAIKVVAL